MEESPSNDVDLDEQEETASIASTIDTEYNSDEEWITSGILADCEIDGETRYLLEWEGFPLFDASWEPRSNLNQKLIDDWELAKKEEGAQRKANNKIWAWRKASMERLQGKLARHEERNRKRRERGLKETSYGENLEDHLAYLGQFPEGEEPEPDAAEASSPTNSALDQQDNTKTSAQAGSPAELNRKPSIAKQDDDDNHSPRSRHRSSPSTHGESSRQAGPPASSATNKDPPRRQSSSDHKGLDVSRKQAPRTSGSLLVNKFGHLKPPQRVTSNISNNQLAVRKTKTPQTLSSNVFVGGTKRKQRPTLLDAVNDLSKGQKVLRPRFARIVQKGQRDREGAVAPAKKPSSLFSLNPADKGAAVRQHPPDVVSSSSTAEAEGMSGLLSHDKAVEHEKNSSTNNQEPAKPKKPKKSVGWGTIEEATIPLVDEPMELDDEESLFVSDHVPISVKRDIGELEEESTVPFPSRPNPPSRRVHWPEEPFIEDDGVRSEAQSLTKDVQFGPKSAVITVTLEQLPQQHGRPWLPTLEKEEKLVFTHTFSQPRQLWSLFKWIRNSWDSDRMATRLVICAGFDKWLLDLAADKSTRPSNRMRLDKEGIEALYKAWHRTRELIDRSTEENTAFIFAPESIDANDEQSLVNWFGWWSIMNMDQFRRFNVLGSSETDPRKLAFRIHRPKYTISTFGNPDEVVAMLDREESKNHQGPDQPATEPLGRAQLQLVPGDDAHALTTFLQTVDSKNKASKWTPQIVYKFPVSYWNSGMAWDFGDYQNSFGTYNKLLRFAFDHVNKSSNYNTTMAFCYTIEGGWDPNGRPGAMDKTRRPWIMIYRAVEPHYKPWKAAELFIWDAARRHPVGEGQQVYEGDLIEAQRQLIHAIHEQDDAGAARGLPLTKVWVGGLDGRPTALTEPIDITLHYLQRFVENIKICLPAPADKLPARGWTLVKRGNAPATSRPPSTESMDIDVPEAEPNTDNACLKMVFHPPRGKQIMRPTECKNRLYQHTQVEIARSQHQQSMEFKFRPTMEWYRQQVEEGRGFEHIRVTTWDAICEMYKIEDTEQGLRR
ncbi:hypothetical protein ACJ41O_008386 [Fusarium nematophilum]